MTDTIENNADRQESILNGTDAIFNIDDNPNANSHYADNYAVHGIGALAVYRY
jgi:hypothetical protein